MAHDPAFFDAVVRPFVAHKLHKTFVDWFLTGDDLSAYRAVGVRPHAVERILLAMRVPEVADGVARLIGDAVHMLPSQPERDALIVAALLGASALEPQRAALAMDDELFAEAAAMAPEVEEGPPTTRNSQDRTMVAAVRAAPRAQTSAGGFPGGGGAGYAAADADLLERGRGDAMCSADKTEEWAETGWWKRRVKDVGPELIAPNRFWRDLVRHVTDGAPASKGEAGLAARPDAPFLSPHLGDCASSAAEAMCALAFLDVPFVAGPVETTLEDMALTITPRSHALAARARIVAIEAPPARSAVLVGQSYVRADDRWEWDGSSSARST